MADAVLVNRYRVRPLAVPTYAIEFFTFLRVRVVVTFVSFLLDNVIDEEVFCGRFVWFGWFCSGLVGPVFLLDRSWRIRFGDCFCGEKVRTVVRFALPVVFVQLGVGRWAKKFLDLP